jgi:cysteinyl-tRNA synthetase
MRIYNTLTRQVEEFKPIKDNEVNMYVCGPTAYNYFHVGNARPFIVFDTFRNYLKYKGYKVKFVQNITDIEDKIIKKAAEEGITFDAVAKKYTDAYFEDIDRLKIERPDVSPKATEEIKGMIGLIKELMDKGYAYASKNGVYFSVEKFKDYGKLSHKNIDELKEGARVEVDDKKNNPLDFALWKFSKPGEPEWESPWGKGRPGWHIECSVMSSKNLGTTFDIHGGGNDLIFPHHENEIAQSEAASGKKFVNYWMHNGFMNINGEKMSKSTGNIVLCRDLLEEYRPEIIRMFILSAHYRSPIDFTKENIDAIKNGYNEISAAMQILAQIKKTGQDTGSKSPCVDEFIDALDNDFNTPVALSVIFKLANTVKTDISRPFTGVRSLLDFEIYAKAMDEMTGVLKIKPEIKQTPDEIKALIEKRSNLRKEKKFSEADKVKDELKAKGYSVEDTRNGTFVIKQN